MKNKELLFKVLGAALDAGHIGIKLQEKIGAVFGEESPIAKDIQELMESLGHVADLKYEISGQREPEYDEFKQWLDEERDWGRCKDCAFRTYTDEKSFHRCAKHGGTMSSGYGCHDFKPKEL